jgi:hypothetical protein
MQRIHLRAKSAKNDLKPTDFLNNNFYFETEGVSLSNVFSQTYLIEINSKVLIKKIPYGWLSSLLQEMLASQETFRHLSIPKSYYACNFSQINNSNIS